jgi:hypothetical protein
MVALKILSVPFSTKTFYMATVCNAMIMKQDKNLSSKMVERGDDKGQLCVIIIRNIGCQVIAQNRPPDRVGVYEFMAKLVLRLPVSMGIKCGGQLLARPDLARTLVSDHDGKLSEIATLRDMVLAYAYPETAIA